MGLDHNRFRITLSVALETKRLLDWIRIKESISISRIVDKAVTLYAVEQGYLEHFKNGQEPINVEEITNAIKSSKKEETNKKQELLEKFRSLLLAKLITMRVALEERKSEIKHIEYAGAYAEIEKLYNKVTSIITHKEFSIEEKELLMRFVRKFISEVYMDRIFWEEIYDAIPMGKQTQFFVSLVDRLIDEVKNMDILELAKQVMERKSFILYNLKKELQKLISEMEESEQEYLMEKLDDMGILKEINKNGR